MPFDPTIDLTNAEREQVNAAGLTVPALRAFWAIFPDLNLDVAIGGLKAAQAHVAQGQVTPPTPETPNEIVPGTEGVVPPVEPAKSE